MTTATPALLGRGQIDNHVRDLVGSGFDAGIHLDEFIERDMIAVRVVRIPDRGLTVQY